MKLWTAGGWHRKPANWQEVGMPIPNEELEALPQYTSKELGIERHISAAFKIPVEHNYFLVAHEGGLYVVNTEGATYARYVRYVGTGLPIEGLKHESFRSGDDTTKYVRDVLKQSGYDPEEIMAASFVHMNQTGKEVHMIAFPNPEDEDLFDHGYVYIWEENGRKRADF